MLGLSWLETLFILLAAILILGPQELPSLLRKIKLISHKIQKIYQQALRDANIDQLQDFEQDVEQIENEIRQIVGDDGKIYQAYDVEKSLSSIKNDKKQTKS